MQHFRIAHDIPDIQAPEISDSEVRFGRGSDFGFKKPSRFFGLPSSRSESTTTRFGMGSVSAVRQKGHRKRRYDSSTLRGNGKESVVLIIPWSQVRVLAGPPSPIKIMVLWH
jgi:hypothetical protein